MADTGKHTFYPFCHINVFVSNSFSFKFTAAISPAVESSRHQLPILWWQWFLIKSVCCILDCCMIPASSFKVHYLIRFYFCRDFKEPSRLLWLQKIKNRDVWTRSFAQVSGNLQRRAAAERKQNYCCFLRAAPLRRLLMRQLKMISWTAEADHRIELLQILWTTMAASSMFINWSHRDQLQHEGGLYIGCDHLQWDQYIFLVG